METANQIGVDENIKRTRTISRSTQEGSIAIDYFQNARDFLQTVIAVVIVTALVIATIVVTP